MAIVYLMGSDVESDANRQKARLYGIAHELYVQDVEDSGGTYSGEYVTMFHRNIVQKKVDSGQVDALDNIIWNYSDEFALEIDTESGQYQKMIGIHQSKTKSNVDLQNLGWDLR